MTLATRMNRSVDPFHTLGLDDFVRQVFAPEPPLTNSYGIDVYEDAERLYIDAELPGFTREQVDVTIDDGVLTITAERETPRPTLAAGNAEPKSEGQADEQAEQPAGPTWHVRERRAARVRRSFSLPKTVDGSTVDAKLTDGVLRLSLTKRPESKPRKIAIA